MTRSWGGYDPGDPQFQQHLDQAKERGKDSGIKPPPKPTAMQRWLDPKGAKRIDEMRAALKKSPKKKRRWGKKSG